MLKSYYVQLSFVTYARRNLNSFGNYITQKIGFFFLLEHKGVSYKHCTYKTKHKVIKHNGSKENIHI